MKKDTANDDVVADVSDALRRRMPSAAEERGALDRAWSEMRQQPGHTGAMRELSEGGRRKITRWIPFAAAAVLVLAAILTAIIWRPADDALFRVAEGTVRHADTIHSGDTSGAVLVLADESRVEMRAASELSLDRASDGLRIRLNSGGIIVNAAKQRMGHLYVQTRDMTVSVVGTVFVVNAEADGSRVAVLEGKVTVQVQQGSSARTLLPGDQMTTNPVLPLPAVTEQIAWSRDVERHRRLLQQSGVAAPAIQPTAVSAETRAVFETISIRPAAPGSPGGRGSAAGSPPLAPCAGVDLQVDPRRFAVRNIPLYGLITLAYGKRCDPNLQHVGGPPWLRTDGYDVVAAIPPGSPGYSAKQLRDGTAPALELMLQAMLADRFQLVIRRDTQETPVYNLVVVTPGKLTLSAEQNPPERVPPTGPAVFTGPPPMFPTFELSGALLSDVTQLLRMISGRPVIDRTGLTGRFDLLLNFPSLAGESGPELQMGMRYQLSSRLEESLGLKLEPARVSMEILVIERAERPSEN